MSYTGIIKIPVLFDMSGDTIVYGEDVAGDFVTSHLDFILDMTTEANDISLNAADISAAILVGDQDNTDNLFYSGGSDGTAVDNLCNRLSKAITRGKLVHIPKAGNHSNSGIPLGGRAELVDATGTHTIYHIQNVYTPKYFTTVAPIGDEQMLGEAMARVASIHLVGTPLAAAAFEDAASIQTSLETASGQTFNSGNTAFYNALAVQLSKVLGGSKSSAPMNKAISIIATGGNLASQIYYESFDNEDVTLESTHDTVYVTGRSGSGKALSTIGQSPAGLQWVQKVSDSSLPSSVRACSFFIKSTTSKNYIFDNRDNGGGGDQRSMLFSATLGKLRFWNNSGTDGTASGSGYLPTGTQPTIWYNGEQMIYGGDNRTTHGTDIMKPDGTVITATIMNDGNWQHFYIEYPGDQTLPDSFTWLSKNNHTNVPNGGNQEASIDDLRYFNAPLTTSQIADLAAGNNGNGGGGGGGNLASYDLASSNSSLSGQTYTSSSSLVDWPAAKAFDTLPVNMTPDQGTNKVAWISADNKYSNSNYSGSETTDGYSGEWVQVDIGQSIVLKEYKLLPRPWADDIHAAAMRLFSSTDGTNWTQIQDWTGLTLADWKNGAAGNTGTYKTLGPYTTNTTGRYFRLVVNKLITGNYNLAQIGEIELKGLLPSQVSSGSGTNSYPLDASGTSVPALKSIYEQLMSVPGRSQIMQTRDISGVVDNSNTTLTGGFPFITGDKLVMYLRPKIVFDAQTVAEQSTSLVGFSDGVTLNTPVFNVGRIGQGITGQAYDQNEYYANQNTYKGEAAFNGNVSGGYGWLGNGSFDNSTGAYNKNPPTNTSVDGANLAGSWVEVNVGKKVAVTSYKIYPQNWEKQSIGGRSPHIFKLVYSDDGTNFITADSQTVGADNNDTTQWATTNDTNATYIPKTFTLTNTKIGQYWRLIVTSVYGNSYSNGGFISIQELEINGSDDYSGSGDSGGVDLSGLQTNIVATAENIEDAFPGNATTGPEPEMNKWGWMGSPNSDSLTLESTDVTDIRTIDLHIWKITITL